MRALAPKGQRATLAASLVVATLAASLVVATFRG
jgi:hypothetical protein